MASSEKVISKPPSSKGDATTSKLLCRSRAPPSVSQRLIEKYGLSVNDLGSIPLTYATIRLGEDNMPIAFPQNISLSDIKDEIAHLYSEEDTVVEFLSIPVHGIEYYDTHDDADLQPLSTSEDFHAACKNWYESYPRRRLKKIEALTTSALRMAIDDYHVSEKFMGALLLSELATDPRSFTFVQNLKQFFNRCIGLVTPPFLEEKTNISFGSTKALNVASVGACFFWRFAENYGSTDVRFELVLEPLLHTLSLMLTSLGQRRSNLLMKHRRQIYNLARVAYLQAGEDLKSAKRAPSEAEPNIPNFPDNLDDFLVLPLETNDSAKEFVLAEIQERTRNQVAVFREPMICEREDDTPVENNETLPRNFDKNKVDLLLEVIGSLQGLFPRLSAPCVVEHLSSKVVILAQMANHVLDAFISASVPHTETFENILIMTMKLIFNIVQGAPQTAHLLSTEIGSLSRVISAHKNVRGALYPAAGVCFFIFRTSKGQNACSIANASSLIGCVVSVLHVCIDETKEIDSQNIKIVDYLMGTLWGLLGCLRQHKYLLQGSKEKMVWLGLLKRILPLDMSKSGVVSEFSHSCATGMLGLIAEEKVMASVMIASVPSLPGQILDLICNCSINILSRDNACRALACLTHPILKHSIESLQTPLNEPAKRLPVEEVTTLLEDAHNEDTLPNTINATIVDSFKNSLQSNFIDKLLETLEKHSETVENLRKQWTFYYSTRLSMERATLRCIINILSIDVDRELTHPTIGCLIKLLYSQDQIILEEIGLCLWLVAHNDKNRRVMGDYGAVEALITMVTAPFFPKLGAGALGNGLSCLWLLVTDTENARKLLVSKSLTNGNVPVLHDIVRILDMNSDESADEGTAQDMVMTTKAKKSTAVQRKMLVRAALSCSKDIEEERSLEIIASTIEKKTSGETNQKTDVDLNTNFRGSRIVAKNQTSQSTSETRIRTILFGLLGHLWRVCDEGRDCVLACPIARGIYFTLAQSDGDEYLLLMASALAALIIETPNIEKVSTKTLSLCQKHFEVWANISGDNDGSIENLLTRHLKMPRSHLRCAVARFFAQCSRRASSRSRMAINGATQDLTILATCQNKNNDAIPNRSLQFWALNAILNASSSVENQEIIANEGLEALLEMACGKRGQAIHYDHTSSPGTCPLMFDFTPWAEATLIERLAVSILSNLETNVKCRTKMFKQQLLLGYQNFRSAMSLSLDSSSSFVQKEMHKKRLNMARGTTQRLLSSGARSIWDEERRKNTTLRYDQGPFGAPFNDKGGQWAKIASLTTRPGSAFLPRKGSQRVGVISHETANARHGENPWEPNVNFIGETESKEIEVTLNPKEFFIFRAAAAPQVPKALPDDYHNSPANLPLVRKLQKPRNRLFKWKHTIGSPSAKVYDGVFNSQTGPAGHQNYFFRSSCVPVEPEDFGDFPLAFAPLSFAMIRLMSIEQYKCRLLEQCEHTDLFEKVCAIGPFAPEFAGDLSVFSGRMSSFCLGGRTQFGVSQDMITIIAQVAALKKSEEEKPAGPVTKVEKKPVWDIKKSVFMPRTHHSDSRNMLQTNGVVLRALKRDWAKVLEEDRFWKFVFTHDDDTNSHSSQAELERELKKVKHAIAPYYEKLLSCFAYYGGVLGSESFGLSYMIGENDFMRFAYETKIIEDEPNGDEFISELFVLVNVHIGDAKSKQHSRFLTRAEFLEAVCRLSVWKCRNIPDIADFSDMVQHTLRTYIPKLVSEATYSSTKFRQERTIVEATDHVLREHRPLFKALFQHYSEQMAGGIPLGNYMKLMEDSELLRSSVFDFSERDARMSFFFSKDLVVDDIRSRTRAVTLTFEDFMEALLFIAEYLPLPNEMHLEGLGLIKNRKPVNNFMLLFESKICHLGEDEQRRIMAPRRPYNTPPQSSQSMDQLFTYFIHLFVSRLAIKHKGRLLHPTYSFVRGGYITEDGLFQLNDVGSKNKERVK